MYFHLKKLLLCDTKKDYMIIRMLSVCMFLT